MLDKNQIKTIIYRAIDRVNEVLLEEDAIAQNGGTILMGEGAKLDSMGFVNFVVALEEEFVAETGFNLNLVERLNTTVGKIARIRTIDGLIDFLLDSSKNFPSGESSPVPSGGSL